MTFFIHRCLSEYFGRETIIRRGSEQRPVGGIEPTVSFGRPMASVPISDDFIQGVLLWSNRVSRLPFARRLSGIRHGEPSRRRDLAASVLSKTSVTQ